MILYRVLKEMEGAGGPSGPADRVPRRYRRTAVPGAGPSMPRALEDASALDLPAVHNGSESRLEVHAMESSLR